MEMLALPALHYITAAIFIVVCLLTMLVVLIQKGRGGGLSGAFGGVGGHSAFGAKTGDVFTWITVGLAACFLLLAVVLNFVYVKLPASVGQGPAVAPAQQPAPTAPGPGGDEAPAPPVGAAVPAPTSPLPAAPTPAAPPAAPAQPTPETPAQ